MLNETTATVPAIVTETVAPVETAKPKRTRKLSGAATKPATEAKPEASAKPAPELHGFRANYLGASQPIRAHGRKLSPIVLDRVPNSYTDRDNALLKALHGKHGTKQFQRLDLDAGAVSRLIGHGYLAHAGGNLDQRDCKFNVTAKAVKERFAKA